MSGISVGGADGLEQLFHGGALSHAYIVCGERGGDEAARALASAMVCTGSGRKPCGQCSGCRKADNGSHPDIIYVEKPPDKKEIPVENVREIVKDAAELPNESAAKVYVIRNASDLNANGQNALLKILEEPPGHVAFIIVAENPDTLLPTVRSRCVEFFVGERLGKSASAEADSAANGFFEALYAGALPFVKFSFSLDKLDRAVFSEFVERAREIAASKLRALPGGQSGQSDVLWRAMRALRLAQDYLRLNVSAVHVAGMLCAELLPRK
ncbi:MAG: hypothetical protein LBC21_04045 [Oscillospiraceae bacterium]|nr:hypothetical protein [Oscillospiraceae bacterium]